MTDQASDRPLSPSFFEGRALIDILSWEWAFSLGVSRIGPRKYRFQGGLDRVSTIKLKGRIQAPQEHRGRSVDVYIRPFDSKTRFSRRGLQSVGSLILFRSAPAPRDYEASLMLPEADLATLAIALSTTSRYLHVWTAGLDVEIARITNYSFSATIGEKVKPWAGLD